MDSYQYFIVLGSGLLYVFKLKHIRRPIFCAYNCFHEFPPMGIRKVTSLLSSERARTATRSGVMLSKAPTFEGYILACMKRLSACSLARPRRTCSYSTACT